MGDAVPGHLEAEELGQIGQGHIAHLAGQVGGGVHGHAARLLGPVLEGQAGLSFGEGDAPVTSLDRQPQLGADAGGDLGPVLPVDIGGDLQLQRRPIQGHRHLGSGGLGRQTQGQRHGQGQHQRQRASCHCSHTLLPPYFSWTACAVRGV